MEIARHATQQRAEAGNSLNSENHLLEAAKCFGLDPSEHLATLHLAELAEDCAVWPEHWGALLLYNACQGQTEVHFGAMGGRLYMPAKAVNVHQELQWLNLPEPEHRETVELFRAIEREALSLVNQREAAR